MTVLEETVWVIIMAVFFVGVIVAVNWLYETITGWFNIDDLHDLDVDEDEVTP